MAAALKGRRIDRVTNEIEDQTRPPQRPPHRKNGREEELGGGDQRPDPRYTANGKRRDPNRKLETRGRFRGDWKTRVLEEVAEHGCITYAAQAAGVDRSVVYRARQQDEQFAVALADALELSADKLEAEAVRRAKSGSDLLLIFLLRHIRPFKFNIEHYHKLGPIQMDEEQILIVTNAITNAMTESDMSARQQQVFRDALETHLQAHEAHA